MADYPSLREHVGRMLEIEASLPDGEVETVECIIAENDYGHYCVPVAARHRPACQAILRGAVWEPDTIDFLIQNRGNGDIVHAGTFFGNFLPALGMNPPAGTKVWAFEPVWENHLLASVTLGMNEITCVELAQCALGQGPGSALMATADDNGVPLGGGAHVLEGPLTQPGDGAEVVDTVALDDVIPGDRRLSILQLDVEGFEGEALKGAKETIRRCAPVIILENTPRDTGWFRRNILDEGYHATDKLHANTVYRKG